MAKIELNDVFLVELEDVRQAAAALQMNADSLTSKNCTKPTIKIALKCKELQNLLTKYQLLLLHDVEELIEFYKDMEKLDESNS